MMIRIFRLSSVLILINLFSDFWLFGSDYNENLIPALTDARKIKFDEIATRLDALQKKLESFTSMQEPEKGSNNALSPGTTISLDQVGAEITGSIDSNVSSGVEDGVEKNAGVYSEKSGFYFIPFGGVIFPSDLEWNSAGGFLDIDGGNGISGGLRVGYSKENLFTDVQLSYFGQDLKSINLPLSFSGEVRGFGIHVSGGGRFHLSESIAAVFGGGFGGVQQDISFSLSGIKVEEKNFLFSAQFLTGLEYHPFEQFAIGLHYRWLPIQGMDSFSSRSLHHAELSAGYFF